MEGVSAKPGAMIISWHDKSNNETAFQVQRCAGAACKSFASYTQVRTISSLKTGVMYTMGDVNVAAGQTLCYRVASCAGAACSAASAPKCATAIGQAARQQPSG